MRRFGAVVMLWCLAAAVAPVGALAEGPFGGSVTALVAGPGSGPAWAGTERGLFRFEGNRWRRVDAWGVRQVTALAAVGEALLAAEHRNGLWRSADGGASWEPVRSGLASATGTPVREVLCLAAGPNGRVYLGSAGQGTFRSDDVGRTWVRLDRGLEGRPPPAYHVTALLPPEGDRPLLAGTDGGGLFAWGEGGWTEVGGLPPRLRVSGFAAEPGNPGHVLLATRGEGLWESRDAGATWKRIRKGLFGLVTAAAVAPGGGWAAAFAGEGLVVSGAPRPRATGLWKEAEVRVLSRAGEGWLAGLAHDGVWRLGGDLSPEPLAGGMDATTVLALWRSADGTLWAGDGNGAFRSADGGATWRPADAGLPGAAVTGFLEAFGDLYAGTGGRGVFRWNPGENRWDDVSQGLGTANTIFSLATDGAFLYAGTEGGVVRRSAEGPWEHVAAGLPPAGRWAVAAAGGAVWAAGGGSLYRSADRGETWDRVGPSEAVALAARPEGGLWSLEPFGLKAWAGADEPPRIDLVPGEQFTAWAFGADQIWLGTNRGLWRWRAGGGERAWEGARVTALWAEGPRAWVGTDGRGVMTP
ncbi:ligand-binding sensor domain-containing protein [Deferrisoma palaeochoriense]